MPDPDRLSPGLEQPRCGGPGNPCHKEEDVKPEEIRDRFRYHPPSENGKSRHNRLTHEFTSVAMALERICPDGREKSLAMTKLEEAKFWASAAVARNPETR